MDVATLHRKNQRANKYPTVYWLHSVDRAQSCVQGADADEQSLLTIPEKSERLTQRVALSPADVTTALPWQAVFDPQLVLDRSSTEVMANNGRDTTVKVPEKLFPDAHQRYAPAVPPLLLPQSFFCCLSLSFIIASVFLLLLPQSFLYYLSLSFIIYCLGKYFLYNCRSLSCY